MFVFVFADSNLRKTRTSSPPPSISTSPLLDLLLLPINRSETKDTLQLVVRRHIISSSRGVLYERQVISTCPRRIRERKVGATHNLGSDRRDNSLKSLTLLIVILSSSRSTELLEPILSLLDLIVELLLVRRLELASESLVVGDLGLERVDDWCSRGREVSKRM